MDWNKLIAELDERHAEDVYEFVVTILSFRIVAPGDENEAYDSVGLYLSHTPHEIKIQLGQTDAVTWFGKKLRLTPENVRHAEIVSAKNLVLDALELINGHRGV